MRTFVFWMRFIIVCSFKFLIRLFILFQVLLLLLSILLHVLLGETVCLCVHIAVF